MPIPPNLDRLGRERAVFDNCYVNNRICTPSRASMMTGKHLPGHGVYRLYDLLPEDGGSPLRWCLFVTPAHGYAGAPLEVEAVLANEGVLRPGTYPVTFRIWSGDGGCS